MILVMILVILMMILVMIPAVFRVIIAPQTQIQHIAHRIIPLIWKNITHKKNNEYIDH